MILTITASAILAYPAIRPLESQISSEPSAYGANMSAPYRGWKALGIDAHYGTNYTYAFTGQQIRVQYRNPMFGWSCPPCQSSMNVYIDGVYQGQVHTDGTTSWRTFYTNPVAWGNHTVTFRTVDAPWSGYQEWHQINGFWIYGWADTTPPAQTVTYSTTNWTSSDVIVTLHAEDAISGINLNMWRFKPDSTGTWSSWTNCGAADCNAAITENGALDLYSRDKALVVARQYPRVDNIDKVPPSEINPGDVSSPPAFPDDTWVTTGGLAAWDWPDASDSGSGVDGYRVYFGDDPAGSSATIQGNSDYSADVTTDGIYYLRSQAVDLTGNATLWANLYTVRVDGTNPVSLPSANGSTAWGDATWFNSDTTLGLLTTDNLSGVNLSQFRVDGGAWGGTSSMTTDGVYAIEYEAEDVAGNGINGTRTFRLDKTPPGLISTIPPVDGSNGWYVTNPGVSVSGTDALSGVATEEISLNGGGSWGASSQSLTDGTYSTVFRIQDAAGNIATENHTIKVDTVAPALSTPRSGTSGNAGWYTSDTTINHAYSDATSGLVFSQMNVNSGGWQPIINPTYSDGVYSIEYSLQDEAGNHTSVTETLRVDTIPPTRTVTVPAVTGNNGWYKVQPTVAISGTDGGSGLDTAEISLNGGATWIPATTTLVDGTYTATFQTTDVAGNQSQELRSIKVDTTDPVIAETITGTSGAGGWYVSDATVGVIVSDATSGVFGEEMRIDGGGWVPTGSSTLTDGMHTIEYHAEDEAGNMVSRTITVDVDTTDPMANVSSTGTIGANGWFITDVGLTLTSSDITSGVAQTEYQVGTFWYPYAGALTLADGTHDVRFRVTDTAGNVTITTPITYRVDTAPPDMGSALTGSINQSGWANGTVELTGNANDPESGLLSFEVNINGAGWVDVATADLEFSVDGVYEILCRAVDTAGNTTEDTIMVQVDTTPPESRFTNPPEGTTVTVTDGVITLVGATTDNLSGVGGAEISLDNGASWQLLDTTGGWSFDWDTTTVPDGSYIVLVRAVDRADNQEHTTRVTIEIENDNRPIIEVPSQWYIWEEAPLRVRSKEKIKEVSVRIYDSEGRWEYYVEYDGNSIPLNVQWNRIFGFDSDGRPIHAPPGVYLVEIIAKNERNRDTVVHSTIIIPGDGGGGVLIQAGLNASAADIEEIEHAELITTTNQNTTEYAGAEDAEGQTQQQGEELQVTGAGTSEDAGGSNVPDVMAVQGENGNEVQSKSNQYWMPLLGLLLILLGILLVFGMRAYQRSLKEQEKSR